MMFVNMLNVEGSTSRPLKKLGFRGPRRAAVREDAERCRNVPFIWHVSDTRC